MRLTVKTQLIIGFAIILGLMALVSIFGMQRLRKINKQLEYIVDVSIEKVKLSDRINQNLSEIVRAERDIILVESSEKKEQYAKFIEETGTELEAHLETLSALLDETDRAKLEEFDELWNQYGEVYADIVALARLNSNVRARSLSANEGHQAYVACEQLIRELSEINDREVAISTKIADDSTMRVLLGTQLIQDLLRIHRAEKDILMEEDQTKKDEYSAQRQAFIASADQAMEELNGLITEESQEYLYNFEKAYKNFKFTGDKTIRFDLLGETANARFISTGSGQQLYDEAEEALNALVNLNKKLNREAVTHTENARARTLIAAKILQDLIAIQRSEKHLILESAQEEMNKYVQEIATLKTHVEDNISQFEQTAGEDGKAKLAEFRTTWAEFITINETIIAASLENGNTRAFELSATKGRDLADQCEQLIAQIVQQNDEQMKQDKIASHRSYTVTRNLLLSLLAVAVVFGIGVAVFIVTGIVNQLGADPAVVADIARRVAEGDLSIQFATYGKNIKGLLATMQNMVNKLNEIVGDVQNSSDSVAQEGQMMSSSAEQMSQGASEQAAAAEEVSSSMEEMAANIRQNTDNALQTEKLAVKAAKDAREGGKVVSEAVNAMRDIAKKIKIIGEIAQQTRMLSLNATIEAARAEEYGRGFTVVASEVRALAERSRTAATEINNLANSSVAVVEKAGEMLNRLVPDIQKTAELVLEITAASKEQDSGASQINNAIQQLDLVIQKNASIADEISSTAENLAGQAEQLRNMTAFFKTDTTLKENGKREVELASKTRRRAEERGKKREIKRMSKNDTLPGYLLNLEQGKELADEHDTEFERF